MPGAVLVWFDGPPGVGKTTLLNALERSKEAILASLKKKFGRDVRLEFRREIALTEVGLQKELVEKFMNEHNLSREVAEERVQTILNNWDGKVFDINFDRLMLGVLRQRRLSIIDLEAKKETPVVFIDGVSTLFWRMFTKRIIAQGVVDAAEEAAKTHPEIELHPVIQQLKRDLEDYRDLQREFEDELGWWCEKKSLVVSPYSDWRSATRKTGRPNVKEFGDLIRVHFDRVLTATFPTFLRKLAGGRDASENQAIENAAGELGMGGIRLNEQPVLVLDHRIDHDGNFIGGGFTTPTRSIEQIVDALESIFHERASPRNYNIQFGANSRSAQAIFDSGLSDRALVTKVVRSFPKVLGPLLPYYLRRLEPGNVLSQLRSLGRPALDEHISLIGGKVADQSLIDEMQQMGAGKRVETALDNLRNQIGFTPALRFAWRYLRGTGRTGFESWANGRVPFPREIVLEHREAAIGQVRRVLNPDDCISKAVSAAHLKTHLSEQDMALHLASEAESLAGCVERIENAQDLEQADEIACDLVTPDLKERLHGYNVADYVFGNEFRAYLPAAIMSAIATTGGSREARVSATGFESLCYSLIDLESAVRQASQEPGRLSEPAFTELANQLSQIRQGITRISESIPSESSVLPTQSHDANPDMQAHPTTSRKKRMAMHSSSRTPADGLQQDELNAFSWAHTDINERVVSVSNELERLRPR